MIMKNNEYSPWPREIKQKGMITLTRPYILYDANETKNDGTVLFMKCA